MVHGVLEELDVLVFFVCDIEERTKTTRLFWQKSEVIGKLLVIHPDDKCIYTIIMQFKMGLIFL